MRSGEVVGLDHTELAQFERPVGLGLGTFLRAGWQSPGGLSRGLPDGSSSPALRNQGLFGALVSIHPRTVSFECKTPTC